MLYCTLEQPGLSYVRIIDNMLSTWYPELLVRTRIPGNTFMQDCYYHHDMI